MKTNFCLEVKIFKFGSPSYPLIRIEESAFTTILEFYFITVLPRWLRDILQEAVIETILKKMKCKKAKWLSKEALKLLRKEETLKAKEKLKDITI